MNRLHDSGAPIVRASHASKLKELGFPDAVAEEAALAYEEGLFSSQPSPDLLMRTMERCEGLFTTPLAPQHRPPTDPADLSDILAAYYMAVADLDQALGLFGANQEPSHNSTSFGYLAGECLAAIGFAKETRQRPMMLVDNHNVISPGWWITDSWFTEVREGFAAVNRIARTVSAPPSAVVMVPRPSIEDYAADDIRALGTLLDARSSEVWIIPDEQVGAYKHRDVVVFGDERAMMLEERCATPSAAFRSFREVTRHPAREVRADIEALTRRAIERRPHHGSFGKGQDDVRGLLGTVISRREAVRLTPIEELAIA